MRRLMSLGLAVVFGISGSSFPVRAEEMGPVAVPAAELLPGMTPAQNEQDAAMQAQVVEGMQAQAAGMEPQPAAAANPQAAPAAQPAKSPIDVWIEKNYPKAHWEKIKEQMGNITTGLGNLPPGVHSETTIVDGNLVIQIKIGDTVVLEIVIYPVTIFGKPIGVGIDISPGQGNPPVIEGISGVVQTLPIAQQLGIMLEAIEAALDYLDPPVLPPGITPEDLLPPVIELPPPIGGQLVETDLPEEPAVS